MSSTSVVQGFYREAPCTFLLDLATPTSIVSPTFVSPTFALTHQLPATTHHASHSLSPSFLLSGPVVVPSPHGVYVAYLPLKMATTMGCDIQLGQDWFALCGLVGSVALVTDPLVSHDTLYLQ